MRRLRTLLADRTAAAAIEFAIAVPALVMMVWGIFQVGILYQANAGMQHALGEGARLATIWPTPSQEDIQAKITSAKFGVGNGTWDPPTIDDSVPGQLTIGVSYNQPTDFLFFTGPTVNLSATKRVYLAS